MFHTFDSIYIFIFLLGKVFYQLSVEISLLIIKGQTLNKLLFILFYYFQFKFVRKSAMVFGEVPLVVYAMWYIYAM